MINQVCIYFKQVTDTIKFNETVTIAVPITTYVSEFIYFIDTIMIASPTHIFLIMKLLPKC